MKNKFESNAIFGQGFKWWKKCVKKTHIQLIKWHPQIKSGIIFLFFIRAYKIIII